MNLLPCVSVRFGGATAKTLLRREQFDILQPYYNEIRDRGRGVIGLAMAQAMSIMAHSPIPGGRRFTDVASDQWPIVGGDIPFTADITDFNDRWRWIENDMLPRWQALNRNNPRAARDLVRTDLQELANRNLLLQGRDVLNFVLRLLPPHFMIP